MKSVLIGNGINIQFGGTTYSNYFILERIKSKAKLGGYDKLFKNSITGEEIISIFNGFVNIANGIRTGKYDKLTDDTELKDAFNDFKKRYKNKIKYSYNIMLEDWFLLVEAFFLENDDLSDNKELSIQGFEEIILDSIYNEGKLQEIYKSMSKKVKDYFADYDKIFTLNYDNNIDHLTEKNVFHLHGDFSVLNDSENPNIVNGYIRNKEGKTVVIPGYEHCYCNALLNYSGKLKLKKAEANHRLIVEYDKNYKEEYLQNDNYINQLNGLKVSDENSYKIIMTKIKHPELKAASEYYFENFKDIKDELHIIGLSPNNDDHIFNLIRNNKNIKRVIYYYYSQDEKEYIDKNFPKDVFISKSVENLWKSLGCKKEKRNFNYFFPKEIDIFIDIVNGFSKRKMTKEEIIAEINSISLSKLKMLYTQVKSILSTKELKGSSKNQEEFEKKQEYVNYVALQEGINPSSIYIIYFMYSSISKK